MADIKDFFKERIRLPSPPIVALKILKAVRSDDSSFEDLSEIIKVDPALTAQVLKLANSSLYGLTKNVDSLAQATALIGTQTLKNIALSFVFVGKFQMVPKGGFDMELFWRRAVTSAVATQVLAKYIKYQDKDIFVTSLLQDIGILILFLSDNDSYCEVLDNKRISVAPIAEAEKEKFGFDHAEIGSYLLEIWGLSENICKPIRFHHSSEKSNTHRESALVISIADKISSIYHGSRSTGRAIEVHEMMEEEYELSEDVTDRIIDEVGENAQEILELFAINPGEMKPLSLMIQEANEELRRLNFTYEQIVLDLKQAKQNAEKLAVGLKQANDRLRELTICDELTGLYNHRYFQETLGKEIDKHKRYGNVLSLLILDIDYFKNINDTFGHQAGDCVLKEIGKIMSNLVRSCDIVARYGGDEFVIILPETGTAGAKVLAQRVRRGIEQYKMTCEAKTISVTVSIGQVGTDIMEDLEVNRKNLFLKSDKALYRAKNNGRNRVET